ncbi:LysR family transcriptional regulator, partial [Salmonella enterica subsp. enterica serovar Kentucky]|nr:LysR family transcriptional regulator [Salmonella enterica subsp. enterica serovar Kentucky]
VEKGNIARTTEALHTLEENVRGPLFVHKGLFGTRPGIKITVAYRNQSTGHRDR